MSLDNKFVWGLVSGTTNHFVGHVIDVGEKITYCGKPVSELINRVYSFKILEGNRSVCTACTKENKLRLANHYKIKEWIQ